MSNSSWCRLSFCSRFHYEQREDSICRENCCHYIGPKMTFFEAWEKAKNGDKLIWRNKDYTEITKKNSAGLQDLVPDQNKGPYFVLWLLEKEWIIIPKKKTVEIEIPEGAKNITISYSEGSPASVLQSCGISKITYET